MAESGTGDEAAAGAEPGIGSNEVEIAVTWHDNVVVLGVSGTLDMVTAPLLADAIQDSLENRPVAVIVDLTGVEFLASTGMTVLIATHEQIGRFAHFAVVADGPAVGRPLRLVGLDKLLTIHTTLDAALDAAAVK
ncbi:STAS domain-containing protein [Aldersonia kunmingensis]|uniref:STAS domain-containing protein n=1 Tax=Aldersonia kunmingensis TaxID=408066 RepID=UPI000A5AFE44|nr:STAS domain-containing protein [Aldersonia kunmingensis]